MPLIYSSGAWDGSMPLMGTSHQSSVQNFQRWGLRLISQIFPMVVPNARILTDILLSCAATLTRRYLIMH